GVGDLHDHGLDGLWRDLVVMRGDRIDDGGVLAVNAGDLRSDCGASALALSREGLADVMEEGTAASKVDVCPKHLGKCHRDLRGLNKVRQHVLAVRRAQAKATNRLDQLLVNAAQAHCGNRVESRLHVALMGASDRLGVLKFDAM